MKSFFPALFIILYYFMTKKNFPFQNNFRSQEFRERFFPLSAHSNTKIYEILHNTDICFSLISIIISSLFLFILRTSEYDFIKLDRIAECQSLSTFFLLFLVKDSFYVEVEEFPLMAQSMKIASLSLSCFFLPQFLCPDEEAFVKLFVSKEC